VCSSHFIKLSSKIDKASLDMFQKGNLSPNRLDMPSDRKAHILVTLGKSTPQGSS